MVAEIDLEYRFGDEFNRHLYDPVPGRRQPQGTQIINRFISSRMLNYKHEQSRET